jgi:hypothetical protein
MIKKDILSKANNEWSAYLKPISELSKDGKSQPLVNSSETLFCFDDIVGLYYSNQYLPASTDALSITDKAIELIEFKTGFKRRITRDGSSFDKQKACCDIIFEAMNKEYICEEYWKLFSKLQDKNEAELIDSLKAKAIESYIVLEKQILGRCQESSLKLQVKLTIVIDDDGDDILESTLTELAQTETSKHNCIGRIKKALKRFNRQIDANGDEYLYDMIDVVSATEFTKRLKPHG